jgi:protoheme IX farnesyltransferase
MTTSALAIETSRGGLLARVADYVELTKPRIAVLVLVTVVVSMSVAGWGLPNGMVMLHTLLGTTLVAASASALNQWLERDSDARMPRTENRPLPGGRLTSKQVAWFGAITIVLGTLQLALVVRPLTALLGLATWATYVWVYTPLKSRSSVNTVVGAVAGALPVLMGWSAVAPINLPALALFAIVFLWQFPHFMAIAWLYRREYAQAGMQMLTVVDPSGIRAGAQAVVTALWLVPISLLPVLLHVAGGVYFAWALAAGVAQLACAVAFLAKLDETSARRLLLASLVYLPSLMLLLMLGPFL